MVILGSNILLTYKIKAFIFHKISNNILLENYFFRKEIYA